jgi:hypothetical protein
MATACVLIWFKSILCTVSYLPCPWTWQFYLTEIQHSPGFPVSFRAEGHHVACTKASNNSWSVINSSRIQDLVCKTVHMLNPRSVSYRRRSAAQWCKLQTSQFIRSHFTGVRSNLSPSTVTLPHRKPASTTNPVQSGRLRHNKADILQHNEAVTLLCKLHMATGIPLPFLPHRTLLHLASFMPFNDNSGPDLSQIIRKYPQIRSVAATVPNGQPRTADKKWSSGLA